MTVTTAGPICSTTWVGVNAGRVPRQRFLVQATPLVEAASTPRAVRQKVPSADGVGNEWSGVAGDRCSAPRSSRTGPHRHFGQVGPSGERRPRTPPAAASALPASVVVSGSRRLRTLQLVSAAEQRLSWLAPGCHRASRQRLPDGRPLLRHRGSERKRRHDQHAGEESIHRTHPGSSARIQIAGHPKACTVRATSCRPPSTKNATRPV